MSRKLTLPNRNPTAEEDAYLRKWLNRLGVSCCAKQMRWTEEEVLLRAKQLKFLRYMGGRRGQWTPADDSLLQAGVAAFVRYTGFSASCIINRLLKLNKDKGLEVPEIVERFERMKRKKEDT